MRIRTATQDRSIAGLQAQRAGIGGDIGATFIDDADNADRRAHALDRHTIRALPFRQHFADGILELGDDFEALGHGLDARLIQDQTVEERAGDTGRLGVGDISFIGGDDLAGPHADGRGHCQQRLFLLPGRRQRQNARSLAGAPADVLHQIGDGGGGIDGFQRRGHGVQTSASVNVSASCIM